MAWIAVVPPLPSAARVCHRPPAAALRRSWTLLGCRSVTLLAPATREAPLRVKEPVQQQAAVGLGEPAGGIGSSVARPWRAFLEPGRAPPGKLSGHPWNPRTTVAMPGFWLRPRRLRSERPVELRERVGPRRVVEVPAGRLEDLHQPVGHRALQVHRVQPLLPIGRLQLLERIEGHRPAMLLGAAYP